MQSKPFWAKKMRGFSPHFFLCILPIDKTAILWYDRGAHECEAPNLPLYTLPAFLSREISHKFQFYFFPLFGYFTNRQISINLLYYIMSGGKSKTYGKAVPLTIIPEADTRNVPSVACRTNFQKKFEKPLDKPLDLWYNEYIK